MDKALRMIATEKKTIKIRGLMALNEPMKRHTSWGTGGHAQRYFQPTDIDDLSYFLQQHVASGEALYMIGLGSNLLVRDGGFKGTIIRLSNGFNNLSIHDDVNIHVGAGVTCAKVARISAANGLTGGEFLAGIPGTMGGALAMNAGAFGRATWDIVCSVETIDREGNKIKREATDFTTGYRHVPLPDGEWFIATELLLSPDPDKKGAERIRQLLDQRAKTQPTGVASCGSVFLNPSDSSAAELIEASGLKGSSIGGAYVSPKHANFIINSGDANAADIESLIQLIQAKVKQDNNVDLIPEVVIIGERLSG